MNAPVFISPPVEGRGGILGVNVVLRADKSSVHLLDIASVAQGKEILDELDGAIASIEAQLDRDDYRDLDWRRGAEIALKRKRRIRPALQERIGELRRAERKAQAQTVAPIASHVDAKRRAFIKAAEAILHADDIADIWDRARRDNPQAFVGDPGVSSAADLTREEN